MTLGRISILLITLAILAFFGIHLQNLIAPPALTVDTPQQGLVTSNHAIEIKGKTAPGARVEINQSPLLTLQSGQFSRTLVLPKGVSTIEISARKRYGRPAKVVREVLILEGKKISKGEGGGI